MLGTFFTEIFTWLTVWLEIEVSINTGTSWRIDSKILTGDTIIRMMASNTFIVTNFTFWFRIIIITWFTFTVIIDISAFVRTVITFLVRRTFITFVVTFWTF